MSIPAPPRPARSWAFNLAVPLIAAGFALAGIVQAQGEQGAPRRVDCTTDFSDPEMSDGGGLGVAPSGDLFMTQPSAGCVIRIDSNRAAQRVAVRDRLGRPTDIEVGSDGTLYVIDADGYRLRAIAPDGTTRIVADRETSSARGLNSLAKAPDGRLYAASWDRVYRIDPSGPVVVAGGGGADAGSGGAATATRLDGNTSLAAGPGGTLYIAQHYSYRVLRVDPAGMISVFAGIGLEGDTGDNGPAVQAAIVPEAVAADDAGNVYIAQRWEHRVRRIDPSGQITLFAGRGAASFGRNPGDGGPAIQGAVDYPTDLALHDGNLYILEGGLSPSIRKVNQAGIITTVAG